MTFPPRRAAPLLLLLLLFAAPAGGGVGASLGRELSAWLATLDAGQQRDARFDFDDPERFDLRLAPFGLEGLRGDRLANAQWHHLKSVLAMLLSPAGMWKVTTIMSLEREVRSRDRAGWLSWPAHFFRDERRYYLALFGEPGPDTPFGLRFDGHHLSLNWTVTPGALPSVTPLFLGSEPREVSAEMERAGLRALPEEEDLARELVHALDQDQRQRAALPLVVSTGPFGGDRALFLGGGQQVNAADPAGLARTDMNEAQRGRLDALLDLYASNFAKPIEAAQRAKLHAHPEATHFAYAGGERAGEPGYYRIQGRTFLIEFDNTVEAADHVHVVWREFDGDFGRDLLAAHHALAHAPSGAD